MLHKLYIGNLPLDLETDQIVQLLLPAGLIPHKIVLERDSDTDESLGFVFVFFDTPEIAERAAEFLDGRKVAKGLYLKANVANSKDTPHK